MKLYTKFSEERVLSKTAIVYVEDDTPSINISYRSLYNSSQKVAQVLDNFKNHYMEEEEIKTTTIGIYCNFKPTIVACMMGILNSHPFSYIPDNLTVKDTFQFITLSSMSHIFCSETNLSKLKDVVKVVVKESLVILGEKLVMVEINHHSPFLSSDSLAIAYVISTSGSTGRSKIVKVPYECIVPNVEDFIDIFKVEQNDVLLNVSPITFDPSIIDIFIALNSKATLVMVSNKCILKTARLKTILAQYNISILQCTPTLIRLLERNTQKEPLAAYIKSLRILALGGEPFPTGPQLQSWLTVNGLRVFNLYGITEVSCWATYNEIELRTYVSKSSTYINGCSIGQSLSGTTVCILDDAGQVVKDGGTGIIMIGGQRACCRILSYNKCSNQLPENSGRISINDSLVITGDRGIVVNGEIFYVGRFDDLIKRNAHLISLNEIEDAIKILEDVSLCKAIFTNNLIILYCTLSRKSHINIDKMKNHLQDHLTSWKLPDHIRILDEFSLNINGKICKASLKKFYEENVNLSREKELSISEFLSLVQPFFGSRVLSLTDNFVELGGNSLQAATLSATVEKNVPELFQSILNDNLGGVYSTINSINRPKITNISSIENGDDVANYMIPVFNRSLDQNRNIKITNRRGFLDSGTRTNATFNNVENFSLSLSWKLNFDKCLDASPLIFQIHDKKYVAIGSHSHTFIVIDGDTGVPMWTKILPDRLEASATVSPDGLTIYVGCYDCCVYALSTEDGSIRFCFRTQGNIKCSVLVHPETSLLVFGSYDKKLYCVSSAGKLVWKTMISNGSIYSSPISYYNKIFCATLDGYLSCIDIGSGKILWKKSIIKPIFSSIELLNDTLLFGCVDHFVYCYSMAGILCWKFETKAPVFSSPFIYVQKSFSLIAIGSHDNHVYILNPSGILKLKIDFTSPVYGSPFISHVKDASETTIALMVAETCGQLNVIIIKIKLLGLESKIISRTSVTMTGELFSSPILHDNKIYLGCRDDYLYCYSITQKCTEEN